MNFWRLLAVCLTGVMSIIPAARLSAQGCNDVVIQYQEPDCYKPRPGAAPGGSTGNNKSCIAASACEGLRYSYAAGGGPWTSYSWSVLSGPAAPAIAPSPAAGTVSVVWPVPGTYVLSLTVTDASGGSYTKCLEISVKERPVAGFTFFPNNACAGSVTSFTNTSTYSGTAMYSWDFGDPSSGAANISSAASPTHVFSGSGSYSVTLIAYSSITTYVGTNGHGDVPTIVTCCADTIRRTVNVASGAIKIECISTVCPGKRATYTAAGCSSPVWGTPLGGTTLGTSGNTITVQWGTGSPQGQLSVSCGGCTSYATVPIVPASPAITGPLNPCLSGSSMYTAAYLPGTDYQWTLTNLTTSTVELYMLTTHPENNTAWINWSNAVPGHTYQLSLSIGNKHICCGGTASITIAPRPTFRINNTPSICRGQSAAFFPDVTGTYTWSVSPASGVSPPGATGPSYSASFSTAGSYIVTATTSGTSTCNTTASAAISVIATPAPDTIVGPKTGCAGNPYTYAMSAPAPAGYYYQWTISSGVFQPLGVTSTTGNSAIAQFSSLPGTILVTLQQSAAPFCVVPADTITVNPATPGSVSGPTAVCVDGTATYTLGGGSLPAGTNITWSITPASLGTITAGQGSGAVTILWHGTGGSGPWGPASVQASTGCGSATPQGGIMVSPKFVVTIATVGLDICQPGGMSLTANGAPAGATYSWSPGSAATQTITGVSAAGTYTVTATAGGCSFTTTKVLADPFAIIGIACGVPVCTGTGISEVLGVQVLKPAAGSFVYEWRSGTCAAPGAILQTTTSASLTNQFTATAPGNYCVIVKYGNCQKCVGFVVKNICCPDINQPVITTNTQLSCNQYSFTATTINPGGAPLTWNFGDGTTATGVSGVAVTHTYANAGVYCVTFCVGPPSPNTAGCTGNCAATIAVVPIQPLFEWKLGCNGCLSIENTSLVYGNSAYVTYSWNWGDATTSPGQNPAPHCYTAAGNYTVTLSMTYNDGAISCTKTFTQNVTHTALAIANSSPVCAGVPASFSSLPGGFLSYNWDFGDGFHGFTSPIQHAYASGGSYNVTLSVLDALGNTCTASGPLTVLPGFGACSILPGYICPGSSAVLTAPAGASGYQWQVETSPGVFANASGLSTGATYSTTTPGYYRVIVVNGSGCSCTTAKVAVTAVPKPKAGFTVDASKQLCSPGGTVILSAAAVPGLTYAWYTNGAFGTPFSTGSVASQTVLSTTSFSLVVKNQYGCTDTCTQVVTVSPAPAPPTVIGSGLCAGVPVTLNATPYSSNISWNTGQTTPAITVLQAGTYIATYTDPATGCSRSGQATVFRRPAAGLFPQRCDSIPCICSRPFTLYAPKPLAGNNVPGIAVLWYDAASNAFLGSGPSYNNSGAGVQTGSYYAVLIDSATQCKDTSNAYSVVVPPCDTCDCKGSTWGNLTLGTAPASSNASGNLSLSCGKRYSIPCNKTYTLNAAYNCKDSVCNGKVTYVMQPPGGSPVSGTGALSFTPTTAGVHTVTVYGWCGKKPCDSCVFYLVVTCPCECKGSSWGPIALSQSGKHTDASTTTGAAAATILSCKKSYALECSKPYTLNAAFFCPDSSCNAKVTYKIQPPGGAPLTGTMPFTATPSMSGTYTVTLYGWCGTQICDSCIITFTVNCPCSCKESYWGKIIMKQGQDDSLHLDKIGDPVPVATVLTCKKTYNLDCKSPYTFSAMYFCKDSSCPGKVTYSLQPPSGAPLTGTMPLSFTPGTTGGYVLTVYAWCGDAICDSCVIRLNVDCDCCKGSKWLSKTITNGTTTKNLKCDTYAWPCNQTFGINAAYGCATDACGAGTSYQLVPPSGAGPVQTGSLPLNYTPTVSGTYTVTMYGYCGGQLCDSCVASFKVECRPVDSGCCKYDIAVKPGAQTYSQNSGMPATILSQGFSIGGLTGVPLSEVRAEVLSFDISANFDDCLACKSMPFVWASIRAAAAISGVPGLVTMYNGATTSIFNPAGAAVYQNPREVIWNNGTNFMITGPLQLDFFLPPMPKPDCCKLRGRICVKFTFRGVDCTECEAVACFDIAIP